MRNGWHQVAFKRDVTAPVTALDCSRPMFALRTRNGLRIFDATCPHRGANLGVNGKPDGDGAIICPFHGRRIGLGAPCDGGFVREHETLEIGGLVLVRVDGRDNGLRAVLSEMDRNHFFIAGFALTVNAGPELVIENAFDEAHFQPVHDVCNEPVFTKCASVAGEHAVSGTFMLPASPWQETGGAIVSVPYTARAFSAGIVVSHMGGRHPYHVITCATSRANGGSTIRLSIALPGDAEGRAPDTEKCQYLLRQMRAGLEKDITIWSSLCADPIPGADRSDAFVREFRRFTAEMERTA